MIIWGAIHPLRGLGSALLGGFKVIEWLMSTSIAVMLFAVVGTAVMTPPSRPAVGPVGLLKHGRWERITVLRAPETPEAVGQTVAALAAARGRDPFDTYFDLIVENGHDAAAIFDYIDEVNIRLLLQHPAVMICSDGQVLAPYGFLNDPPPYSPCSYGEFPGVLERYVRDEPLLTLQEAIRRHVGEALKLAGGVRTRAASMLAIDRKSLWRMMQRHKIA